MYSFLKIHTETYLYQDPITKCAHYNPVRNTRSQLQPASPQKYLTRIFFQTSFQVKQRSTTIFTLSQDWWWVHTASHIPTCL